MTGNRAEEVNYHAFYRNLDVTPLLGALVAPVGAHSVLVRDLSSDQAQVVQFGYSTGDAAPSPRSNSMHPIMPPPNIRTDVPIAWGASPSSPTRVVNGVWRCATVWDMRSITP
ncbi:hypothetical protein O0544_01180 [Edwardsiella anguillarum]|nr:hypothetical protein [Edwardsiella anguillarum]